MLRRYLGTAVIAVAVLLASPRAGSASLVDFIWEMSGPQMIGVVVFHCEYRPETKRNECRALNKRVAGDAGERAAARLSITFDATIFTSTGKDSDTREYQWFKTNMLAFEPVLELRSYTRPSGAFTLHHGLIGLSYDYLFGSNFDSFHNTGLKFIPIGITFRNGLDLVSTVRVYPDGFTSDEFGPERLENVDRKHEAIYGFSVGWGH